MHTPWRLPPDNADGQAGGRATRPFDDPMTSPGAAMNAAPGGALQSSVSQLPEGCEQAIELRCSGRELFGAEVAPTDATAEPH